MYTIALYVLAGVPKAISVLNDALVVTSGSNGNNGVPALSLVNKDQLQARNGNAIQNVLTRRAEQFNTEDNLKEEARREFALGNTSTLANVNNDFKPFYSEFVNLAADDLMGIDPNTLQNQVVFDAKQREEVNNFLRRLKRAIINLVQNMSVAGTLGTRPLQNKWSTIVRDSLGVLQDVAVNNIASDDQDDHHVWSVVASLTSTPRSTVKPYVVHARDGGTLLDAAITIYQRIEALNNGLEDESDVFLRDLFYGPGVFPNNVPAANVLKPPASIVKNNWALQTWS